MGIGARQTGSAVRHVETPFPIVRLVPGNRLADREEICRAIAPEELERAIVSVETALVTGLAARV
jgi:hypothetical protein